MKITYDDAARLSQIEFTPEELAVPDFAKTISESITKTTAAYYSEITKQIETCQHETTERAKIQFTLPWMQPQLIQK